MRQEIGLFLTLPLLTQKKLQKYIDLMARCKKLPADRLPKLYPTQTQNITQLLLPSKSAHNRDMRVEVNKKLPVDKVILVILTHYNRHLLVP